MSGLPDGADLLALARSRRDALVDTTQRFVRIDSQTPPSDTRAIAGIARAMLTEVPGAEVSLHESEPPVTNLLARLRGDRPGPRLVLSGHLDTYPIGDRTAWSEDPLGGAIRDGRLYGRGSADMKGACAVLIECFRLCAERLRPFPGEIVLALAGDEERMGELGTQWMLDNLPEVHGDGVIVADVGGPHTVRLGEKGMVWIEVEAHGRAAHGAHVHAGENALDRLVDALTDLRRLEPLEPAPPAEAARTMRDAAAKPGSDPPSSRRTMERVTVNLGELRGGVSANLVPAFARAGIDIRLPLGIGTERVETEIAQILGRHPAVSWEVTRRYEPTWTRRDSPVAEACLAATRTLLDAPSFTDMRIGGSDARLWRRAGIDTVVQGLTPSNLGAPDENLVVDELPLLLAIQCAAARRFLFDDRGA